MTLLPSSDRAFQSQVATRDGTQNTLVWIDTRLYGFHLTATHSGGTARVLFNLPASLTVMLE
jgi:hypothetical protein